MKKSILGILLALGLLLCVLPGTAEAADVNATVDPTTAEYDLNTNTSGLTFMLYPGSYTLTGIKNNNASNATLTVDTDYTTASGTTYTITITPSYLDKQSVGIVTLTFDMSGGTNPEVTIAILGGSGLSAPLSPFGSRSGSSSTAPPKPVISAPVTAGDTSTVTTQVKPTVSGTAATATIPADAANSAVDKAVQAAQENNTAPAVQISVDVTATAASVAVTLPAAALATLSGNADAALIIASNVGNITLDSEALSAIVEQAGTSVTVSIAPVKAARLTAAQRETVGDAPVFDLSITSGNRSISDLGGGKAEVSVPYMLSAGKDPKAVVVYYLDDAGNLHKCDTVYDPAAKTVSFVTDHFSKYVISYDEALLWESPFADVTEGNWFYDSVRAVVQAGLFEGTSATAFAPQTPMTRAMIVTVLYRYAAEQGLRPSEATKFPWSTPAAYADTVGFDDVAADAWYAEAVLWAAKNGIVNGTGEATFSPDDMMTREQMAAILYRYEQYNEGKAMQLVKMVSAIMNRYEQHKGAGFTGEGMFPLDFPDADQVSDWAYDALYWCIMNEIINGNSDGTLAPQNTTTRAEVAAVFARVL